MSEFFQRYGSEAKCAAALAAQGWAYGFRCLRCSGSAHWIVGHGARKLYQCRGCRHQTSMTAGTLMDSTKLPLSTWFPAMFLIGQANTGLSALALKRHLGTSYRTAWLNHQKIIRAMVERDCQMPLKSMVPVDDAYIGGLCRGACGRGSPDGVLFVAAVSTTDAGYPLRVKLGPISGFTTIASTDWARKNLVPGCDVRNDSLICFAGVINADCAHSFVVEGGRKLLDLPQFKWVITVLGNLNTMIKGADKSFGFGKYARQYLGTLCFRFNRRFDLRKFVPELIGPAVTFPPVQERAPR